MNLLLTLVMLVVFMGVFFGISELYLSYKKNEILKNPSTVIGTITHKRSHKNRGIDVTYFVNGKSYTYSTAVSAKEFEQYKLADKIEMIYNKLDPSQAMPKEDFEEGELEGKVKQNQK